MEEVRHKPNWKGFIMSIVIGLALIIYALYHEHKQINQKRTFYVFAPELVAKMSPEQQEEYWKGYQRALNGEMTIL